MPRTEQVLARVWRSQIPCALQMGGNDSIAALEGSMAIPQNLNTKWPLTQQFPSRCIYTRALKMQGLQQMSV